METITQLFSRRIWFAFKSYYVVWKRVQLNKEQYLKVRFKSYYVVWKLKCQNSQSRCGSKFKSYYVVWKPISHAENSDYIESLNRTM